jgi:hypothetical protein
MFVRQADQPEESKVSAQLLKGNAQYSRFVRRYVSEDPTEYGTDMADAGAGVVVPVVTETGGIVGKKQNPYGRVVVGSVIGSDDKPRQPLEVRPLEDRVSGKQISAPYVAEVAAVEPTAPAGSRIVLPNTIEELQELLPTLEGGTLQLAVRKLQLLVQKRLDEPEEEETPLAERQAGASAELEMLMRQEELEQMQRMVVPVQRPAPAGSVETALFAAPVRVRMEGTFGRSTSHFLAVERHADQLILIYDPEDNIFVPASNGEPFNLYYADQRLQVQNIGIEFDLDFLKVGVLVFVIHRV